MEIKKIYNAMDISASGLSAQRRRMDAIASNIANVNTTRTAEGGPYRRKITTFEENKDTNSFAKLLDNEKMDLKTTDNSHLIPEDYTLSKDSLSGVKAEVNEDNTEAKMIYDPTHPDANEDGYVAMPNINIVSEMVDMMSASRSYEANVTALNAAKGMIKNALMI